MALARRIPALSSHRFLLSAHSLRCLNDWTIEDVLHWLLCQEHPLNTICGDACMCMCVCLYLDLLTHCHQPPGIHLAASPLLPASLHFLLCLAELLVSSIILKMNRTGSFFFCLWQLVYVFLHASFFKQALHTVAGLTLHCWGPLTTYWSQIAFRIHSLADLRTAASPK